MYTATFVSENCEGEITCDPSQIHCDGYKIMLPKTKRKTEFHFYFKKKDFFILLLIRSSNSKQ